MNDLGKMLLVSPNGMLGRAWAETLEREQIAFDGLSHRELDLTDDRSLDRVDFSRYSHVINCSAYTDVDGAETAEEQAHAVNAEGVGRLAERCRKAGSVLVHYSTDYVFDGMASEPYPVDAPIDPVNAYGRSKAAGEARIRDVGGAHLILRTSWLYAPWGKNFVLTMVKLGRERSSLRVVDDQRGRPTSSEHLAATSLRLMQASARGTFHVTDGEECTWFQFAWHIVGRANPACVVSPCSSAEYPRPARRPAYSVLALDSAEAVVGPMPAWQQNLDRVLDRVLA